MSSANGQQNSSSEDSTENLVHFCGMVRRNTWRVSDHFYIHAYNTCDGRMVGVGQSPVDEQELDRESARAILGEEGPPFKALVIKSAEGLREKIRQSAQELSRLYSQSGMNGATADDFWRLAEITVTARIKGELFDEEHPIIPSESIVEFIQYCTQGRTLKTNQALAAA